MKILIAIHATHANPAAMQAQRETWLRNLDGADYKFFVGDPAIEADDVVPVPHPDGPRFEPHGYRARTWFLNRKTEALAAYALSEGYDFAFKCDDDTFVRLSELLASGFEEYDYSGYTDPHFTQRTGHYRWAQGGAGYWLSRKSMAIIDRCGLRLNPAEDFAVGELLAQHGIAPHHDARYTPVSEPKVSEWITLHKIGPERMRELWAAYPRIESLQDAPLSAFDLNDTDPV